MVAEPTTTTYSDAALTAYIEAYPLLDERGEAPYTWDASTAIPTQVVNPAWVPTYDLHAAAGDIWEEKAGAVTGEVDFSADGASVSRSQGFDQCVRQAAMHRSRRAPRTMTAVKWPPENSALSMPWLANMSEPDRGY
jgi:hypothetical protein